MPKIFIILFKLDEAEPEEGPTVTKTETPFALALRPILLISKLRWIYGNNELLPVIIEI